METVQHLEFSPKRTEIDQFLREHCPAFTSAVWSKEDVISEARSFFHGEIAKLPDIPEARAVAYTQLDAFISYLQTNLLDSLS